MIDFNAEENKNIQKVKKNKDLYFTEVEMEMKSHNENNFVDFDYQGLITFMLSKEGPSMSVGDVDNDGLDDIFIGAAKGQSATIYLQKPDGSLTPSLSSFDDEEFEDTASLLFDADGDGDLDLYAGSGGNEGKGISKTLTDRLYLNDGRGGFILSEASLPLTFNNTSVVRAADMDQDGDLDLFVGSRSIPGTYGVDPENYLLENDGTGHFKNVIENVAYDLKKVGMITDAQWKDFTGDGSPDLIVIGDWMSPVIYENNGKRLDKLESDLDQLTGLWNTMIAEDLDQDGNIDLVLGNRGTNTYCRTSPERPAKIYINDFDNNGTIEQIMTRNIDGRDVPIPLRRELSGQLSSLKKEILKFSEYATKSIDDLFPTEVLDNSIVKSAATFESVVVYNNGDGTFDIRPLPLQVQFSSMHKIVVADLDKDGVKDLILGGNNYNYKPQFTRTDASYGEVLLGNSDRSFSWIPPSESGFFVKGQVRSMEWISSSSGRKRLVVGLNDDKPKIFEWNE
jgi:hypothetical protein